MIIFRVQFFHSKKEAIAFKKGKTRGRIYSNAKWSHTKKRYREVLRIISMRDKEYIEYSPYVVVWVDIA